MTFILSLDLPLRAQLSTCAFEDFFDIDSAPYPPATMVLLSKMSHGEMDQQLFLGSPEWKRIVLKILHENAGTLSAPTQNELCTYLVDHNVFLSRAANALGISRTIGGRTGPDAMAIAFKALIPNRFETAAAEDWLTRLLGPALQMITAYNAPRLAALPSTKTFSDIPSPLEEALMIMANKAEAAAKARSVSCNFTFTYPLWDQQNGLSTSAASSTMSSDTEGPSHLAAAPPGSSISTRPIAGSRRAKLAQSLNTTVRTGLNPAAP
ncbi:hypothetical protein C8R46DRAFT_1302014 [Mycena filopes]|nr:hypothetical protein C8R46DRAFT_1302014 [Mycena filopes]